MSTRPASAVLWRGIWLDPLTRDLLVDTAANSGRIYIDPIEGYGSYADNDASANIDAGGGHGDLDAEDLDDDEAEHVVTLLRERGAIAYLRPRNRPDGRPYGWQRHIHLTRYLCADASPAARAQWDEHIAGYDGLASRGRDPHTRAYVRRTWEQYLQERDTMNTAQEAKLDRVLDELARLPQRTWDFPIATVDPDPNDGIPPKRYPASTYTVMANYRAQLLQDATRDIAAQLAELAAREDVPAGPVQDTAAVVAGVLDKLAQGLKP